VLTLTQDPPDRLVITQIIGPRTADGCVTHFLSLRTRALEGRDIWDLVHFEDQPVLEFMIRQMLRGESTAKQGIRLEWGPRDITWVEVNLRQLQGNQGTLEMICEEPPYEHHNPDLAEMWDRVLECYAEDDDAVQQSAIKRPRIETSSHGHQPNIQPNIRPNA